MWEGPPNEGPAGSPGSNPKQDAPGGFSSKDLNLSDLVPVLSYLRGVVSRPAGVGLPFPGWGCGAPTRFLGLVQCSTKGHSCRVLLSCSAMKRTSYFLAFRLALFFSSVLAFGAALSQTPGAIPGVSCNLEPTADPSYGLFLDWASPDQSSNSHAHPVVGDLDGDGTNEVVVTNRLLSQFSVLDGLTGSYDPVLVNAAGDAGPIDLEFQPAGEVSIADLDRDGNVDIIISEHDKNRIERFYFDNGVLTSAWGGPRSASGDSIGIVSTADFDGDGTGEIYYRDEIMSADGTILVESALDDWERNVAFGPVAADVLDESACALCGGPELITGGQVWAVDVSSGARSLERDLDDTLAASGEYGSNTFHVKFYPNWDEQWTSVSVADYDLDGDLDVLLTGALGDDYSGPTTIFMWDVVGDRVLTYSDEGNNYAKGVGRIAISDVDGDGQLNAVYISGLLLYVLKQDFTPLWTKGVNEGISGYSGVVAYDFNDDGASEIVHRDQGLLQIVDGSNGDILGSVPCSSITQEEYPVVADVDGDGETEICVPCLSGDFTDLNIYDNTKFAQIRLYRTDDIWLLARSYWNQHAFSGVNIDSNLQLPQVQPSQTRVQGYLDCRTGTAVEVRPYNSFLTQSTYLDDQGCPSYQSADLELRSFVSVEPSQCPAGDFDVTLEIVNSGDITITNQVPVTFYIRDPRDAISFPPPMILNTEVVSLTGLAAGESMEATLTVEGPGGEFKLFAVINDTGIGSLPLDFDARLAIPECETSNNLLSTDTSYTPFSVNVEVLSQNLKCRSSLPDNGHARASFLGVTGSSEATIWSEGFEELPLGSVLDEGDTAWSLAGGDSPSGVGVGDFSDGKVLRTEDSGGKNAQDVVTWVSAEIDIQGYSDVSVSLDLLTRGVLEVSGEGRDFARAYYILDGGAPVLAGEGAGGFGYLRATGNPGAGSSLVVRVELHTDSSAETIVLDNVLVRGKPTLLERHHTEEDGFEFAWNLGGSRVFVGSDYPSMGGGTYEVTAISNDFNCGSEATEVDITSVDGVAASRFDLTVVQTQDLTSCTDPNGILTAEVRALDEDDNPVGAPLLTGFTYTWFFADESVTPIGTGRVLDQRLNNNYTVRVFEIATGCVKQEDQTVDTMLVSPEQPTVVVTDVTGCDSPRSGGVRIPDTTGFVAFEWFAGAAVKTVPDSPAAGIRGARSRIGVATYVALSGPWSRLAPGEYTVVGFNDLGCASDPLVVTVGAPSGFPSPLIEVVEPNTGCTRGNGILRVDGDGLGTTQGYNVEWYLGTNTAGGAPRISPLDPSNSAVLTAIHLNESEFQLGALESGTYSAKITRADTGCEASVNVFVPEELGSLSIAAHEVDITDPTSCEEDVGGTLSLERWLENNPSAAVQFSNLNGSFEIPPLVDTVDSGVSIFNSFFGGTIQQICEQNIPGWSTVPPFVSFLGLIEARCAEENGIIEIWSESPASIEAAEGVQWAEINAEEDASLFFDINTIPGVAMRWRFAHRARVPAGRYDEPDAFDELLLLIGPPPVPVGGEALIGVEGLTPQENTERTADVVDRLFVNGFSDTVTAQAETIFRSRGDSWTYYEGEYVVPDDQYITRFAFQAIYTFDGSNSTGNFIDDISFEVNPFLFVVTLSDEDSGTDVQTNLMGRFEDLPVGAYNVEVFDQLSGCFSDPFNGYIERRFDLPDIAVQGIQGNVNCAGPGTGSFRASATTGASLLSGPTYHSFELFSGPNTVVGNQIGDAQDVPTRDPFLYEDLESGIYRLQVRNPDNSCSSTFDVVVPDVSRPPLVSSVRPQPDASCTGAIPGGQIRVDLTGATSPVTYTWWEGSSTSPSTGDIDALRTTLTGRSDQAIADFRSANGREPSATELPTLDVTSSQLYYLSEGTYSFQAVETSTQCETPPRAVAVGFRPRVIELNLNELAPATSCGSGGSGGGILKAGVRGRSVGQSPPESLFDEGDGVGLTFQWFEGADTTTPLAGSGIAVSGSRAAGLEGGVDYTVQVQHSASGCEGVQTFRPAIRNTQQQITEAAVVLSANRRCVAPFDGIAEVNYIEVTDADGSMTQVFDDGTLYEFQWYEGNGVSTSTRISSPGGEGILEDLEAGFYTVVAVERLSMCSTPPFTFEIENSPFYPTVTPTTADNSVCDPSLARTGTIFSGSIDLGVSSSSPYEFLWYQGAGRTNIIPGQTGSTLTGRDDGTYTSVVTNTNTSCETEVTVTVGDAVTPLVVEDSVVEVQNLTVCEGSSSWPNGALLVNSADITGGSSNPSDYEVSFYLGYSAVSSALLGHGDNIFARRSMPSRGINIAIPPSPLPTPYTHGISGLDLGTYSLAVTDLSTGCQPALPYSVDVPEVLPVVSLLDSGVTVTANTSCGVPNGSLVAVASPGVLLYSLYSGSAATGTPVLTNNTGIFNRLSGDTYTVTATDGTSSCVSLPITRILEDMPVDFSSDIQFVVTNPQTSCQTSSPNGVVQASVSDLTAGYSFQLFRDSMLTGTEITSGRQDDPAGTFISWGGLDSGSYQVQVTQDTSGCSFPADANISDQRALPVPSSSRVPSTRCEPGDGEINFSASPAGGAPALSGTAGYRFDLYDTPLIGPMGSEISSETVTSSGVTGSHAFTALGEGEYSVRVTDLFTSCTADATSLEIDYRGPSVLVDESLFAKTDVSTCFTQNGALDVTGGLTLVDDHTLVGALSGDVEIEWYVGSIDPDNLNPENLLSNLHNDPPGLASITDPVDMDDRTAVDGSGNSVTVSNGFIGGSAPRAGFTGLPAISYSGLVTMANGCVDVFSTFISDGEAPGVVLTPTTQPTRCQAPFDGVVEVALTPVDVDPTITGSGNSASQFEWYLYNGQVNILPDADGGPPYEPSPASYGPLLSSDVVGAPQFTNTVIGDPQTITLIGLEARFYTLALQFDDDCISWVGTIELDDPTVPVVALEGTTDNTVCDARLDIFNGEIEVSAENPDPAVTDTTFDFSWVYDNSGAVDGNFGASPPPVSDGPDGAYPGSNVVGSSASGVTAIPPATQTLTEITGLGAGWYRVEAEHTSTGCEATLDVQLFDSLPILQITDSDLDNPGVVDCNPAEADLTINGIREGAGGTLAAPDSDSDTPANIAANYTLTWQRQPPGGSTFTPFSPQLLGVDSPTEADNLGAGSYSVQFTRSSTGCAGNVAFTVEDIPPDFVLRETDSAENTVCNIIAGTQPPTGSITLQVVDVDGNAQNVGGFDVSWYRDSRVPATLIDFTDPGDDAAVGVGTPISSVIEAIAGGTYVALAEKNASPGLGCTVDAPFTIDGSDNVPQLRIESLTEDHYCAGGTDGDGAATVRIEHNGASVTGAGLSDYAIVWSRGSTDLSTGFVLDPAVTLGFSPNFLMATGLSAGAYSVQIERTAAPDQGCQATATFNIDSNPVEVSLRGPGPGISDPDLLVGADTNCAPPAGSVEAIAVRLDGVRTLLNTPKPGGVGSLGDDYAFTWRGTPTSYVPPAPGTATEISGLEEGDYGVQVRNRVTECVTGSEITVRVDQDIDYPVLTLETIAQNTACAPSATGQVQVSVRDPGSRTIDAARFDFEWYDGGSIPSPVPAPAYTEPAASLETSVYGSGGSLLAAGSYTVLVTDNLTGCEVRGTADVVDQQVIPILDVSGFQESAMRNTFCGPVGGADGSGGFTLRSNQFQPTTLVGAYNVEITNQAGDLIDASGVVVAVTPFLMDPSRSEIVLSDLVSGGYSVAAVAANGCESAPGTVTVGDDRADPNVALVDSLAEDRCEVSLGDGNGGLTITVDGLSTAAGYTTSWGLAGGGSIAPAVDRGLQVENAPVAIYQVDVINDATGCQTVADFEVEAREVLPVIDTVASMLTAKVSCGSPDGEIFVSAEYQDAPIVFTNPATDYRLEVYSDSSLSTLVVDSDLSTPDRLENVDSGEYFAVVTRISTGCESPLTMFTLEDESMDPGVLIERVSPDTACLRDDPMVSHTGELRGYILRADGSRVDSPSAPDYSVSWARADTEEDPFMDIVGVSDASITGRDPGIYQISITDEATECEGSYRHEIQSIPTYVQVLETNVEGVTRCVDPQGAVEVVAMGLGTLLENPGNPDGRAPDLSGFTFQFFDQGDIDPLPPPVQDGISPRLEDLGAGTYFVKAAHGETGCETSLARLEVDGSGIPDPPLVSLDFSDDATGQPLTRNNSSCDPSAYDGKLTAIAVSASDPAATFRYDWYEGVIDPPTISASALTREEIEGILSMTVDPDERAPLEDLLASLPATDDSSLAQAPEADRLTFDPNVAVATEASLSDLAPEDLLTPATEVYVVVVVDEATGCATTSYYPIGDDFAPLVLDTSSSGNTNCALLADGTNPSGTVTASVLDTGVQYRGPNNYNYKWFEGVLTLDDLDTDGNGELDADDILSADGAISEESSVVGLSHGPYTVVAVDGMVNCFLSPPTVVEVEDLRVNPALDVDVVSDVTYCHPDDPNGFVRITDSDDKLFRYEAQWGLGTRNEVPEEPTFYVAGLFGGDFEVRIIDVISRCFQMSLFTIGETPFRVPDLSLKLINGLTHCLEPDGHGVASVKGDLEDYTYSWYEGTDTGADPAFEGGEQTALEAEDYTVVAYHEESGCENSRPLTVTQDIEEEVEFEVEVTASLCLRSEGEGSQMFTGQAAIVFDQVDEVTRAEWLKGDEVVSRDLRLVGGGPGDYTVRFAASNGCDLEETFTIEATIRVYNAVTSNGDGYNDFFLIDCLEFFPGNTVKIFNRAGNLVYEESDYDNVGRRFEGFGNVGTGDSELPAGTYFYVVEMGSDKVDQGFLELLR